MWYKRFFCSCLLVVVLVSVLLPMYAFASDDPALDKSVADQLDIDQGDFRGAVKSIPSSQIVYFGVFPCVPYTDESYSSLSIDGISVCNYKTGTVMYLGQFTGNQIVVLFRVDNNLFVFTNRQDNLLYRVTQSGYVNASYINRYDDTTGWYYYTLYNADLYNWNTAIPNFDSFDAGTLELASYIHAGTTPSTEKTLNDLFDQMQRTNDLLSGLTFFIGIVAGAVAGKLFWGQL